LSTTEFPKTADPKQKRNDKWLLTMLYHRWFYVAGVWRSHREIGEAFTMLAMHAGEDVAPYHHRQIIPLSCDQWGSCPGAWCNSAYPR